VEHFSANSNNKLTCDIERHRKCSGEVKFSNLARNIYLDSVVKLVVFATLLGVKILVFNVFCFDRFIPIPFHKLKPRPNDRNMPTQLIATLLRAFGHRVATVLRQVGCCWLKYDHFQT